MEESKEVTETVPVADENTQAAPAAASRRRRSLVAFNANPLAAPESKADADAAAAPAPAVGTQKFRASIFDSLPVALAGEIDLLIADLRSAGSNEDRLKLVDDSKTGKLFTCAQLKQIIDTTPSIKTKIGMIERIAPQITDPKAGSEIVSQFRFTEDKRRVEEAFKARDFELNAQRMSGPKVRNIAVRGRGGRGAGRGAGRGGRGATTRHSVAGDAAAAGELAQEVAEASGSRRDSV